MKRPGAILVVVVLLSACSCSSRDTSSGRSSPNGDAAAPAGQQALATITLPDLSQMAASAQAQIRDRHTVLTRTLENKGSTSAELAEAYGELGKILMSADHRDAAEPCLTNAQVLAPADFRWPYYLGHLYRENGDLDKAIASFARVLKVKPNDLDTLIWLGNLWLDRGRADEAESNFKQALSLDPNALSALFGLGRAALAKQEFARAVEQLETVLARDPQAAAAHYPLAMAYRGLGNAQKAEAHLRLRQDRQILPTDPLMVELGRLLESPQTYESRGIEALNKKDWSEAAALFRKGLELAPEHVALRHRLGTALYMQGDKEGAQREFERVVRDSPDYYLAQYSLGVVLQSRGNYAAALEHFSSALQVKPDYAEARIRLADALRHTPRVRESLPHYERAIAESPQNTDARFGYAMALVQLARYHEARNRLTEYMRAYPDQLVFAHGLARVLAAAPDDAVRDGEQAVQLVQSLLQKEQRTLELGETLAMALAAAGQYDRAARVQRDLIAGAEKGGLSHVVRRLTQNLALYERHEPCRNPWTEDEMP